MTITIFEIPGKLTAWLMSHLMVKSLASVEVMFTAWCIILMMGLSQIWIWAIDIAKLFLISASEIIRAYEWFNNDVIVMLSS